MPGAFAQLRLAGEEADEELDAEANEA